MTRVKICGNTNREDAGRAVELGAAALGFIFAPSPRRVEPAQAREMVEHLPPFVEAVGVFVNQPVGEVISIMRASGCRVAQLHGEEPSADLEQLADQGFGTIKVFRPEREADLSALADYGRAGAFMLDTWDRRLAGGTGRAGNWELAAGAGRFGKPVILAGGLTAENVGQAISAARPYAVDVVSGVEASPGRKDRRKLEAFFAAVRAADLG